MEYLNNIELPFKILNSKIAEGTSKFTKAIYVWNYNLFNLDEKLRERPKFFKLLSSSLFTRKEIHILITLGVLIRAHVKLPRWRPVHLRLSCLLSFSFSSCARRAHASKAQRWWWTWWGRCWITAWIVRSWELFLSLFHSFVKLYKMLFVRAEWNRKSWKFLQLQITRKKLFLNSPPLVMENIKFSAKLY